MILKQAALKILVNQAIKAIEKISDKKIASEHHRRIKELEKEVKQLKKNSHPQAEFVCVECGCKAKRITKKGEK